MATHKPSHPHIKPRGAPSSAWSPASRRGRLRWVWWLVIVGVFVPAVAQAQQPNIVVIVVDTLRADRLACYGHERETSSHIDRLAERGVLFERCYATSSWTLPSFASLFSGLYPSAHGAQTWSSAVHEGVPWMPSALQKAGYHTAAVSANPFFASKHGFDRGFDVFDDQTVMASAEWSFPLLKSRHKAIVMASTSSTTTRRAMELLAERPADKPLFMVVHYMDCHADYVPPAPWDTKFNPDYAGEVTGHVQSRPGEADLAREDADHIRALYDGEVAHVDDHIGQLIAHLDALGMTEQTLVIVTADHGEELNERGVWGHGHTLYEEAVRVPLIMVWPDQIPVRRRVAAPVSLVDIAPTLAGVLGLEPPPTHGIDLRPLIKHPDQAPTRQIFMETHLGRPLRAMIDGHTKTIAEFRNGAEGQTLHDVRRFDLTKDPGEAVPIAVDGAVIVERYRAVEARTPRFDTTGTAEAGLDADELQRLRSLGYIGE